MDIEKRRKSYKKQSEKMASQLGMPLGTASARLKKMLMFELVKELGKDACFHCGEKILTVKEFSVEHKIPWLDNDVGLFWDMKNISFSHLVCNTTKGVTDRYLNKKQLRKIRNKKYYDNNRDKILKDHHIKHLEKKNKQ